MSMGIREALKFAVQMLAAPPEEQQRWLTAQRLPVDELALQLDDHVNGFPEEWWERQGFAPEVRSRFRALDAALEKMSGKENRVRWTSAALYEDPCWVEVRAIAGELLHDLAGYPAGPEEPAFK